MARLLPGLLFRSPDCILMYHGTPQRHAARLARQLRAIAFFFEVVPLETLAEPGRPRARRRRVALTFDDGLRSNVRVAYPILRELGLPATFFVCPGLVEEGLWLWNHEARRRLFSLSAAALRELAGAIGAPADPIALVQWMKTLKLAERRRIEQAIRAATPRFAPSATEREDFDLAAWDELTALDPRLVKFGSHSLTHPILTSLAPNELDAELRDSRALLEARLGRPTLLFCYPNGAVSDRALSAVRRYYYGAVTVQPGSLDDDVDRYRLPRFPADPAYSLRLARRLALARLGRTA